MANSTLRNYRKIYTTPGSDPSIPGRISNLETNEYKVTYYEVVTGTSGTLTVPSQGTINADEFGLSGNAILSKIDINGKPTFESPLTSGGASVTASLNVLTGEWIASGVYTDTSVALIYSIKINGLYYSNLVYNNIVETVKVTTDVGTITLQSVTDSGNTTTNNIEANAFIKTGGTSTEFLKADGSTSLEVVPIGGTAGQILAKVDDTNYNLEWIENYANYTSVLKHNVKAGEILVKGQAVYVSSANGTNMIVTKASNTTEATSSKTMGLIAQDLANNGQGFVITEGLLSGLNTSTATAGDPVWLGVNGALIYGLANKPYAPAHLVFIGIVTRVSSTVGEIFVKVQNGFELQELHNVDLHTTVPINGHLLGFDGTLWVNKTIAGWLGFIPVPDSRTITINGITKDLTANQDWTIGSTTGVRIPYSFTATAGQTTFTTVGYVVGSIDVYYNGSKLLPSEYTATNGTTIVFGTGLNLGDIIEVVIWNVSDIASIDSFEYYSKNLKAYPYVLNYTGSDLTSIVYTLPSGTITKTFNYTGLQLTSIVLSGTIPVTIATTKTFIYSGSQLTSITYS